MKLNQNTKQKLTLIAAAVFAVVVLAWSMLSSIDHIEDTNGADNFSLQVITDQQIVELSTGATGGPNITRSSLLGSTVEFSSKKYTGVSEILYDNFLLPSDFDLSLTNFHVHEGNFRMVVVHNDQIVATLEPDMFVNYRLENVTGTVSLRIVGESASFTFSMSEFDYDFHSHAE